MSEQDIIEVGDEVQFDFSGGDTMTGTILYTPCATGDAWHVRNTRDQLVYVQEYTTVLLVRKAT